jgi:hypothetical protein
MIKLLLEQHRLSYLPVESVSMQERVRAVEFVLARCGFEAARPQRPAAEAAAEPAADETLLPAENGHDLARSVAREFITTLGN